MGRFKQFTCKKICLKCYRVFSSEGIHNRICPLCTKINNNIIYDNSLMFLDSERETDTYLNCSFKK